MDIFAYFYPGWSRSRPVDEWEIVDAASPLFRGHIQPQLPIQREYIEDLEYMRRSMISAKEHGITGFAFVFYWDNGHVILDEAINNFVRLAGEFDGLKFSIMWSNRKLHTRYPIVSPNSYRYEPTPDRVVSTNKVDIMQLMSYLGDKYLSHPSYFSIDGRPVLQVYDSQSFLADCFQSELDGAGSLLDELSDVSIILTVADMQIRPWMRAIPKQVIATTNYVLLPDFHGNSVQSYEDRCEQVYRSWQEVRRHTDMLHIPSITVGWDATPRSVETMFRTPSRAATYPRSPVVVGSSPDLFERHLRNGLEYGRVVGSPLVFVSSYNEWSEGHFLGPDGRDGYSYLGAIRRAAMKSS